jgi:hypothetical protein
MLTHVPNEEDGVLRLGAGAAVRYQWRHPLFFVDTVLSCVSFILVHDGAGFSGCTAVSWKKELISRFCFWAGCAVTLC